MHVWKDIKPMRKPPGNAPWLTGETKGKLTIIGMLPAVGGQPASWQCQCKCGLFTSRKTKAWDNNPLRSHRCGRCT